MGFCFCYNPVYCHMIIITQMSLCFFFSVVKPNSANIIYSNYWRKCRDKMIGEWCLYTEEIKILVITCTNFPLNWTKKKMLENLTVTQYINNGKAELNPFTQQQVPFFFFFMLFGKLHAQGQSVTRTIYFTSMVPLTCSFHRWHQHYAGTAALSSCW